MSSNSSELFGLRLRAARVRSALSQKDLADKLGVAQPTISTWEKGGASPRKRQLRKLVGIFDLALNTGNENSPGGLIPSFGQWLKQTRIARGLSVRKLSEKSKISTLAIYYIENATTATPHPKTVRAITKALGARPKVTPSMSVFSKDEKVICMRGKTENTLFEFEERRASFASTP